eukprot:12014943-Alexandrium_andersonii.AAC.1
MGLLQSRSATERVGCGTGPMRNGSAAVRLRKRNRSCGMGHVEVVARKGRAERVLEGSGPPEQPCESFAAEQL